jgi:hypothetical protein
VKPERDKVNRDAHRKYWWHYADKRPVLYAALAGLKRCLVTSIHSKHLLFSFQPTDRVFSHGMIVCPIESDAAFTVLQSRVHECWARLLSSTMKTDIRYSPSDCFGTFAFPQPDPRARIRALEDVGKRLYDVRAAYMAQTQQGLTQTYNRLKDPDCGDPVIGHLRELHLEMDRAVLTAYGWADLIDKPGVPPFTTPQTDSEKQTLAAFEDAVIDRLFALNAERAHAEALAGSSAAAAGKNAVNRGSGRAARKVSKGGKSEQSKQTALFGGGEDDD